MRADLRWSLDSGSSQGAWASRPCGALALLRESASKRSGRALSLPHPHLIARDAKDYPAGMPPGFSLIEILLVIAIVAIMATLVAPSLGVFQGRELTRGGDLVAQTLNRAHERAITLNRRVEARFYSFIPPDEPGSIVSYRALQLFEIDDLGNAKPIDRVRFLPLGILMNSDPGVSPLLDTSRKMAFTTNQPSIPKVGTSYTASYVQFRPNGSTDLDPTREWVVTLHGANAGASPAQPPANFYAIEIDPISSAIRTHRP